MTKNETAAYFNHLINILIVIWHYLLNKRSFNLTFSGVQELLDIFLNVNILDYMMHVCSPFEATHWMWITNNDIMSLRLIVIWFSNICCCLIYSKQMFFLEIQHTIWFTFMTCNLNVRNNRCLCVGIIMDMVFAKQISVEWVKLH